MPRGRLFSLNAPPSLLCFTTSTDSCLGFLGARSHFRAVLRVVSYSPIVVAFACPALACACQIAASPSRAIVFCKRCICCIALSPLQCIALQAQHLCKETRKFPSGCRWHRFQAQQAEIRPMCSYGLWTARSDAAIEDQDQFAFNNI